MRKSKIKVLSLMISLAMTVGCFAPLSVNGQNGGSDGFFRGGYDSYENRGEVEVSGGITNDSFNAAPLGSGLMIMVAAGAGYLVRKNRLMITDNREKR